MDLTVAQLMLRLLPSVDPLSLPPQEWRRLEEIVEAHNNGVRASREMAIERARQLLWPRILKAGHHEQ